MCPDMYGSATVEEGENGFWWITKRLCLRAQLYTDNTDEVLCGMAEGVSPELGFLVLVHQ